MARQVGLSVLNTWKKTRSLFANMQAARPFRSLAGQLVDLVSHKLRLNLHPKDYYALKFYQPGKTWHEKSRYVSERGSAYWPWENNQRKYDVLFTDKSIQKAFLRGLDLPTGRLLASIGARSELRTRDSVLAFLDTLREDFVIKPINGALGKGILVLSRNGEVFQCAGKRYSAPEIWQHMASRFERGWLVEERLHNIGLLADAYPLSLNTFRVITLKTRDGKWHMAACVPKLGRDGSVTDNTGHRGIKLWPNTHGEVYFAYDFLTAQPITQHPDTGVTIVNVVLEGYREVVDLALLASSRMGFMGSLGWDIAYTANGPMIIEVNAFWGGLNLQIPTGGMITNEMARGLNRRYGLSRWDRRYYSPRMCKS